MNGHHHLVAATASSLLLVAVPAGAEEGAESVLKMAQRYVDLGEELFRNKSYAEAAQNFDKAEGILANAELDVPAALYRQLARSYDQLGQVVSALGYYKRFLSNVDRDDKRAKQAVKEADDAVIRLTGLLERTALEFKVEPDGTEVRVDNRVVGTTPLDRQPVQPGPHQVTLWADGHDAMSVELTVAAGATVPVVAKLVRKQRAASPAAPAAAMPAPPLPKSDGDRLVERELAGLDRDAGGGEAWRTWTALGLGVAAVGLGVGAGLMVANAADLDAEGDAVPTGGYASEAAAADARDHADSKYADAATSRWIAVALGGAALAAAAGGLYVLLAGERASDGVAVEPGARHEGARHVRFVVCWSGVGVRSTF